MKLTTLARLGLVAMTAMLGTIDARADATATSYPNQLVRIIVPFSAGSVTDILARTLSDKLSQTWKQTVIVENRPGVVGTASVAKARPDGYTIMLTSNGHTTLNKVHTSLTFNPVDDFVGVTKVASMPLALVVAPDSPAKNLSEFIEMVRANPAKLNYASAGLGSTAYIAAELFKRTAKLDMLHIPYKGTPDALTSVMRGDTVIFFTPAPNGAGLVQSGKIRALAVSGTTRLASYPSVPTIAEAGLPEFVYDAWFGVLAPANTPREIVHKISKDIDAALKQPDVQAALVQQGVTPASSSPEDFTALVKSDTARFGELFSNLQQ
jgi:tripartite-type tricarboxylate transporter receptor subunit TctC